MRFLVICVCTLSLMACATTVPPKPAQADAAGFEVWRENFAQRAVAAGYDQLTVRYVMSSVQFRPKIIELDRKQPESQLSLEQYLEKTVSADRIKNGRLKYAQNATLLNTMAQRTGVPASIIVALWGKETSYGAFTGGYPVADALATLAYEGRRREMFERELAAFIQIVQQVQRKPEELKGSWAGAMGQCQFMPTSYMKYAADGNGDGRADIWFDLADVFASSGNFLHQSGWRTGEPVAQPVALPPNLRPSFVGRDKAPRSVADWQRLGVKILRANINPNLPARIYAPDGHGGPAFIIYPNFDVLMRWNSSGYFATGVAMLADQIAQQNP